MPIFGFVERFVKWCFPILETEYRQPKAAPDRGPLGSADLTDAEEQLDQTRVAWWLPAELDQSAHAETPPNATLDAELYDELVSALDNPSLQLPQVPHVAQQGLVMLRSPDLEYRKLAEVISQDAVLTSEVLRIANSVAFRGFAEIRTLRQAFARLGQRELRRILLTTSLKTVAIETGGAERTIGEELWQCSLASAVLMEFLAERYALPPDEAFLVGLLHDIGALAVLKVVHEYQKRTGRSVSRPLFDRLYTEWHEHLGLRLAGAWALPDPLPDVAGLHHRIPQGNDPLERYRLLAAFADVVCELLGFRTHPPSPVDFFELDCVKRLDLKDDAETCRLLYTLPNILEERMTLSA